jgi:hypothetical protein
MVPVDSFVCELVQRLRFFRSFDPLLPDRHLLSRPHGKTALIANCATTYTKSVLRSAPPPASFRTNFGTPTPVKWFAPA